MNSARLFNIARPLSLYAAMLMLPFAVLYYYLPLPGWHMIGNDYIDAAIADQLKLFYSITHGSFPLYVPGFYQGHTASALTLGQAYHPLPWLSQLFPGYWDGYALAINTWLRMLTLAVAHIALYRLFLKLDTAPFWAFCCSFIAVYNMRMLDCFRYSAALESYTGMIFCCAAAGFMWLFPHTHRYKLALVASAYWAICSGHPQMAYFSMLSTGLFTLFIPYLSASLQGKPIPSWKEAGCYYLQFSACMLCAALLSAAYLLPFYWEFLPSNRTRVGQPYSWSNEWLDTPLGFLNSLFLPLRSDVHGDFGGSPLPLLALLMPALIWNIRRSRVLWFALWSVIILIGMVVLGRETPLHRLVWEYLPFAHTFRTPGRFAMLLIPLVSLLLLPLFHDAYTTRRKWLVGLLLAAAVIYACYPYLIGNTSHVTRFSPPRIRIIPQMLPYALWATGVATLLLVAMAASKACRRFVHMLVCLLVVGQTAFTLAYGTWAAPFFSTPTLSQLDERTRTLWKFNDHTCKGLARYDTATYPARLSGAGASADDIAFYKEIPFASLHGNVRLVESPEQFFHSLRNKSLPRLAAIEPQTSNMVIPSDFKTLPHASNWRIELAHSSFNRLTFTITSNGSGYAFIRYPYMENWAAFVDDLPVPVYRANALYMAVPVPVGHSRLELRYQPLSHQTGMAISCIALACMLSWASLQLPLARQRIIAAASASALALAIYALWAHSLYSSDNLGYEYIRQMPELAEPSSG